MGNINPFLGDVVIPSDKSISHRALMFASMAEGTSHLHNLLNSQDVNSTLSAMRALGADITVTNQSELFFDATVVGWGRRGPITPKAPIDCGNSGTTARLIMGIIARYDIEVILVGDSSLEKRPMDRVAKPLSMMGAKFFKANHQGEVLKPYIDGDITLPLAIFGSSKLAPIKYVSPKASAQIKTAILLAGLGASGKTSVVEPSKSRDHTEIMLGAFGACVDTDGLEVSVEPRVLKACDVEVVGDPSSAMFWIACAAMVENSEINVLNVGVNPTRIGAINMAKAMGCDIELVNQNKIAGEDCATIHVKYVDGLKGVEIDSNQIPYLIDEIPIMSLLATCAEGKTVFHDVGELRVKESNRLKAIVDGLNALGCAAEEIGDDLVIYGRALPNRSVELPTYKDHRLAMTWTLANRCFGLDGAVDDLSCVSVSYPGFIDSLNKLQIF